MSNRQIKFEDFIDRKVPLHVEQDNHWYVEVAGIEVSVIKWNQSYYSGEYEIHSRGKLFSDEERYRSMVQVLKRLTKLENKNAE